MTQEKARPDKPNNLYEPVSGDKGAHGRFDDRAYKFSPQLWTDLHRNWIIARCWRVSRRSSALFWRATGIRTVTFDGLRNLRARRRAGALPPAVPSAFSALLGEAHRLGR